MVLTDNPDNPDDTFADILDDGLLIRSDKRIADLIESDKRMTDIRRIGTLTTSKVLNLLFLY